MYGSYMSRQPTTARDLDRERNIAELISKINSLERSQEKLFLVVENQGHELRALIETVLSEIRQSHDLISIQSREASHYREREAAQIRGGKTTHNYEDRSILHDPEQNMGNKVVETHLKGIHDAVHIIVSYMKDMKTESSVKTITNESFNITGQKAKSINATSEINNQTITQLGSCSPNLNQNQSISTLSSGFGNAFKPKAGSWECSSCFTRNNEEILECLACNTLKPGQKESIQELKVKEIKKIPQIAIRNEELSIKGLGLKMNTEEESKILVDPILLAAKEGDAGRMKILTLSGNSIGIEAAKEIGKALESRPELKKACWNNMFTGRMKTEIPVALKYLGSGMIKAGVQLVELDLSDNAFGPIGVEAITDLLRSTTCSTLKELKLNNTGLGVTGGKLLAKTLLEAYDESVRKRANRPFGLTSFVLGRSRQENEGAIALAEVFKKMGTLEKVIMPQNGIYKDGISALADAFKNNPNLRVMDLSDNTITGKGAKSLALAIASLKNLEYLYLGDCLLQTEGAKLIAEGLHRSGSEKLKELSVDSNEINSLGGLALVNAIKDCNSLECLTIDGNNFGEKGCKKIMELLESCKKKYLVGEIREDCGSEYESDEQSFSEETRIEQNGKDSDTAETEPAKSPLRSSKLFVNQITDNESFTPLAASSHNNSQLATISQSIFGGSSNNYSKPKAVNDLFGGKKEESVSGRSLFGETNGAKASEVIDKTKESKSIFGGDKTDSAVAPEKSIFGGGSSISSFASLSALNAKPLFGPKVDGFSFAGAGKSLFNSTVKIEPQEKQTENDEDQVEENEHDPHFEPIIPLPELIEVQTGEEDELEVFKYRAKIFRYDNDLKQWKERGIGDIKILKHPGRLTYRVLLRRDQTLKVACNHLISDQMELKPLSTSETALWWSAVDYADEEPKTEALAVKFKTVDTRNEFKRVFEVAQEEIKARLK